MKTRPGVHYTALWFNARGLERALAFKDKLTISGSISLAASDAFSQKNLNRSHADNVAAMRKQTEVHQSHGVAVNRIWVMAAFGCNFQGDVPVETVLKCAEDGFQIAADHGETITVISLADTMGWAVPPRIEKVVGAVRERWPDVTIALHLHDTRGIAVANAHTALKMGVARFDTTVGGLGGCPFAAHRGRPATSAPRNSCCCVRKWASPPASTSIALVEVGRMAETMVGHVLPSELATPAPSTPSAPRSRRPTRARSQPGAAMSRIDEGLDTSPFASSPTRVIVTSSAPPPPPRRRNGRFAYFGSSAHFASRRLRRLTILIDPSRDLPHGGWDWYFADMPRTAVDVGSRPRPLRPRRPPPARRRSASSTA